MRDLVAESTNSLCERYVSHRLTCDNIFAQPYIQEWLDGQRTADSPDGLQSPSPTLKSPWSRLPGWDVLDLTDKSFARDLLHSQATPVPLSELRETLPRLRDWQPYTALLQALGDQTRVYVGYNAFVVLELGDHRYILRVRPYDQDGESGDVLNNFPFGLDMVANTTTSRAVADVLLAEWNRRGEKADLARQTLTDRVQVLIDRERSALTDEFERAVAVSEDGTQLVHADYVVVVRQHEEGARYSFSVYEARHFHASKFRRPAGITHCTEFVTDSGPSFEKVISFTPEDAAIVVRGHFADRRDYERRRYFASVPCQLIEFHRPHGPRVRIYWTREEACHFTLPASDAIVHFSET